MRIRQPFLFPAAKDPTAISNPGYTYCYPSAADLFPANTNCYPVDTNLYLVTTNLYSGRYKKPVRQTTASPVRAEYARPLTCFYKNGQLPAANASV